MFRKIILYALIILLIGLSWVVYDYYPKLEIVTSYAAKKVCGGTFHGDRPLDEIEREDLAMFPLSLASNSVDFDQKMVESSVFGLQNQKVYYREGVGCVLVKGSDDYNVSLDIDSSVYQKSDLPYPYGDRIELVQSQNIDRNRIEQIVKDATRSDGPYTSSPSRSALVIYKDSLVAEAYARGVDAETAVLGWSMTKSILNAMTGMMVKDSMVSIRDSILFDEWKDDDRANITLNHLLQMSSGLDWNESYSEISDATKMLFMTEDIVSVAKSAPYHYKPGSNWSYSSGSSNLISGYLRKQFSTHQEYLSYPYERIFGPLNMKSAVLETDESGNFIGSSYCYATTRDWGRFGTLYLRNGVWNGKALLTPEWIEYTKTPLSKNIAYYTAHFWANKNHSYHKDAPEDMFFCSGYEGQRVFIIPSKDLVIVRTGLSEDFDYNAFIKDICNAIED